MRYWLMKTEPTTFGVEDLAAAPRHTTGWDGVRNYQARNMLRDEMRRGDQAFLYYSSCEVPGVAAIMQIAKAGYPDPTAFDRKNHHYDPDSDPKNPRWFMVDVQLKRRHDLIPNLVETVKGYAAHERGTLDDVIKARNSAISAQGPSQVSAAENQLSGALGRLIALSEAYPDLKANANFQQLASELSDLENKIAASRRFFNNTVQEYNTGIQQMPAALFAGMFGFTRKDFFDLGASRTEVEAAPSVKF